ncbi:MAG TPA: pyridoxal-phosphate dependent enzyme [Acidimicrobiia bacterium]|nr:pyridoxal-phosphate dependent enzyme [Acidimicrobiia bacterium]
MSSPPDIDIEAARLRIEGMAVRTPLMPSVPLSERVGTDVFLKLETTQPTGAFKLRGAASKILSLSEERRSLGVVTASTGNHGRGVSYVARRLGIPATVCVSDGVPAGKLAALRGLGAKVEVAGSSQTEAMKRGFEIAEDGATFIHPFDDPEVIAGQGTIAAEIAEDLPEVSTVLVPLSGGGLLSGIAEGLRQFAGDAEAVGVSMTRVPIMVMSLEAGRPVDAPEETTLADSLRGGIELDNRHTFNMVRELVERVALVEEDEIWEAMRFLFEQHRLIAEGAAAVGVATLLHGKLEPLAGPVVAVISGANAEPEHVAALIAGSPAPTL